MSKRPASGLLIPKNSQDQAAFSASWTRKRVKGSRAPANPAGLQILQAGPWTELGREVWLRLRENSLQHIGGHGDKSIAPTHPVGPLVLHGHAYGSARHMEDDHAAVWVSKLLDLHAEMQPVHETCRGAFKRPKRRRADDPPRASIRHPQDDATTALVRQGAAVFDQLLEIKASFGLLEFEMLALA